MPRTDVMRFITYLQFDVNVIVDWIVDVNETIDMYLSTQEINGIFQLYFSQFKDLAYSYSYLSQFQTIS